MKNQADIMYKQLIRLDGTDGKINDTECRFLICEENDSGEKKYDLKYVITDQILKQGDYITFNNILHMIIDVEKSINSIYTKGVFREVLKITFQNTLKEIFAIVDKVKGVYAEGQQITEVHDEYTFIVPKDVCNYTSISAQNNLIIYAGGSYDGISIDDSKDGILTITGRFNNKYDPHTYSIILESNSANIVETGTYQISATCKDNGTVVTSPQLTFASSDTSIVIVDDKGLITGAKAGTCNISVNYNGVSATLSLVVNAKPVEPVLSYSYTLSNGVSLRLAEATTITCSKTIDGVSDPSFTTASIGYTLDSVGASALSSVKITVTKGASLPTVQVRNKQTSSDTLKTIHITITDLVTGTIIVDNLAITIKNSTT